MSAKNSQNSKNAPVKAPSAWKISAKASLHAVEKALLAHEEAWDWPEDMVVGGRELDPAKPNHWVLEVWLSHKPRKADRTRVAELFGGAAPALDIEKLPQQDWLSLSQQGTQPIAAGRFYVHTPEYDPASDPALIDLCIPAGQAFGTGQHETTAGCLEMLSTMKSRGLIFRNLADIGAGSGVLAFAAMRLWPSAYATASDIDPICMDVMSENAAMNGFRLGGQRGRLALVIAPGMDDPLLELRAPYDLLMANILAGPLRELAEDFAASVSPRGSLLLSGLLQAQEGDVLRSYRRAGFRLISRLGRGDWSVLWLRKRAHSRHSF